MLYFIFTPNPFEVQDSCSIKRARKYPSWLRPNYTILPLNIPGGGYPPIAPSPLSVIELKLIN